MSSSPDPLTSNPLLDFSGLPRFPEIAPEHVTPAVDALIASARKTLERIATLAAPPRWDNVVEPLSEALDRLDRAWNQVAHLSAVADTPALREAYKQNLPALTAFYVDLDQDERLFERYRALADGADLASLDAARRKVISNTLRDFRLSGAGLPADDKARLKAIEEDLSQLSSRFEDNILDAANDYGLFIEDAAKLSGIPADVLERAKEAAEEDGRPGWKLTLHAPCYFPAAQHADDRLLRETLYRAYATRGSEFGNPEWDNSALIDRIIELRRESAILLGYRSYAEVSLVPKMADDPAQVLAFLRELAARAKPFAERDIAELRAFARDRLGLSELAAWDIPYASEKLRQEQYSFSDLEVKAYFPEDRVLAGMFRVVETIFGVAIRESHAPVWHPSVRFFDVADHQGALIGQLYLDLHARMHKRGGAWMDTVINRRRSGANLQHPVACLTCNFSAPLGDKPALFTHDEVTTLFHEFGHGLNLLLTRVDVAGVSGLEGVEWDAVELPSQFMENFCWEWDVLRHMSSHVDTGAPLPRALFDRMLAAKNFQSGMQTIRQLESALFDMHLHHDFDPGTRSPLELVRDIRREVGVVPRPADDRGLPHGFSHIFAGGYAAGYYSYKWAEVLSADAYSLFEEAGVLSPVAGNRFRDEVLAQGGSRAALDSFIAFRGRAPQIDALLRHNGMLTS
jgi:oligopeptidase A